MTMMEGHVAGVTCSYAGDHSERLQYARSESERYCFGILVKKKLSSVSY